MPSLARQALANNRSDLDRLWEIHTSESGAAPGRRRGVEVLNKAAVVLVCAAWEAYCEDIVSEAIQHLVTDCSDHTRLPPALRKHVAATIKGSNDGLSPWEMAGDGWRQVVKQNAATLIQKMTGAWHTPKTAPIRDLFAKALGIPDITANWKWPKNPAARVAAELDGLVTLRGEIAHRLRPRNSVHKWHGTRFYNHASRIADKIDAEVSHSLTTATGKVYW